MSNRGRLFDSSLIIYIDLSDGRVLVRSREAQRMARAAPVCGGAATDSDIDGQRASARTEWLIPCPRDQEVLGPTEVVVFSELFSTKFPANSEKYREYSTFGRNLSRYLLL